MSLDIARLIAFSGISATELQISVASSNISNADTAGYTVKTANQSSSVTGGVGTGVTITGITSNVDKLLLKSLVGATSDLGAADTTDSYMSQLSQLFGSAASSGTSTTGTSLANSLASLESALSSLASTPSSVSLQAAAVSALGNVATQLRDTSSGIQTLRSNADKDIGSAVTTVNSDLTQISSLNTQIKKMAATGQSTADLEDQRNSALQDLSQYMNVSYYTASNGDMQVYSQSGQALVDSQAHTLSYTTSANVSAGTTFSGITVNGVDITSQITSGKIGALVTLRDTTLPAEQTQLDQLATKLKSALNSVSNGATSVPAPTSMTGTTSVTGSTPISGSGSVRIAVTSSSGSLVSYEDIPLTGLSTVQDLVDKINSYNSATPPLGVTASITNGALTLTSTTSGDGVSINDMTSSFGGTGFSSYFGMNDIVTGTSAANFAVSTSLLNGITALPTDTLDGSATLSLSPAGQVLSPGSATIVNDFSDALTGSTSFASAGGLSATTGSFADYASAIVANVANKSAQASTDNTAKATAQSSYANAMSSQSGVNIDEETAKVSALQNKYTAASQLISVIDAMFASLVSAMQSA